VEREVKQWITVNGHHVPIYEGQTKEEVINSFMTHKADVDSDADKKEKQIQANKAEADEKNSEDKKTSLEAKLGKQSEEWYYKELTDAEKKAVVDAQVNTESLNRYLRGEGDFNEQTKEKLAKQVKELDSALAKFSTTEEVVTYRGVSSKEFANVYLGVEKETKGVKSTSHDIKRAEAFAQNQGGFIIEYHIKPGNHGADVTGAPGADEREFLIRTGMPQKGIKKVSKNHIIVEIG